MSPVRDAGVADPAVQAFTALTDVAWRRSQEAATGLYVAEGAAVIVRALAAGHRLRTVMTSPRWLPTVADHLPPDADVVLIDDATIERITGFRVHRGALASFQRPLQPDLAALATSARRLVALEGLVDPTNVGAIARSALALGFDGMVLDPRCGDPLYRRAVKVSMGAVLALPFVRATRWPQDLDVLRDAGHEVLALTPHADTPLSEIRVDAATRCTLLVGSEGPGLREATIARATTAVRIPMSARVDSLNVAAAAAIACAHIAGVIES
jgi:tRNA G18 (ribose-2'-O)-methylase SpoU